MSQVKSQNCCVAGSSQKKTSLFVVLKNAAAGWMQDNAMRLSAALSLYTILSLAPLLVITFKIVSVVWKNHDAHISDQLTALMGPGAADMIRTMLEKGARQGDGVLGAIISTVVLIFAATGVFSELQDSMNTIWGVEAKPRQGISGFIHNRLLSLAMVFGIAFLLLASMFISTALTTMRRDLLGNAGWFAFFADLLVALGFITLLFAAIYKFLPDVKLKWKHVWAGAFIASALFAVGKYALAAYFKYATPTSAFGAAGSLAAVLLWVYYSGFILFFGAEFTKAWALAHGHRIVPQEIAVKVPPPAAAPAPISTPPATRSTPTSARFSRLRTSSTIFLALLSGFASGLSAALAWKTSRGRA
jgi:membrane protein